MGEAGSVDGPGGEMGGKSGPDFREPVEPGEEVLGQLAVLEAQVELLTDGQREAGDFAVASHRGLRERSIVSMRANVFTNFSIGHSQMRSESAYFLLPPVTNTFNISSSGPSK